MVGELDRILRGVDVTTLDSQCLWISTRSAAAHGFEHPRWTLIRVQAAVTRRFHISLSVASVWWLLKRHGWSWQTPARRAPFVACPVIVGQA